MMVGYHKPINECDDGAISADEQHRDADQQVDSHIK